MWHFSALYGSYPQHVVDKGTRMGDKWNMCNKHLTSPDILYRWDRSGKDRVRLYN